MSKKSLRIEPSVPVDVEIKRGSPKVKKAKHKMEKDKAAAAKAGGAGVAGVTGANATGANGAGANGAGASGANSLSTAGANAKGAGLSKSGAQQKGIADSVNVTAGKNSGVSSTKVGEGADRDTIRIYIRDAKPPIFARILQFFMRIVCFILLLAVCAIGIPRIFGVNEFNVETGSMYPEYPIGTLIFVQPKDPSTIRPGEVVTVIMNDNLDMLTHRVTANDYDNKTITTKGDANNAEDGPSLYENVVGVVVFSVPYAGEIVNYLTNTETGRIVGIGILIGILALTFLAEGICSLLTKQDAKTYDKNNRPMELPNPFPREQEQPKKSAFKPAFKLRSNKTTKKRKKKKK